MTSSAGGASAQRAGGSAVPGPGGSLPARVRSALPARARSLAGPGRRAAWRRARLRRALAALLAAAVVWLVAGPLLPHREPAGVPVLVVTHDLAAGAPLAPTDVAVVRWPEPLRPASALTATGDVAGRVLAGAVAAGEPITPARLRGQGQLTGAPAGQVAVHLPLPDPALVAMVRAGDRVEVLSAADGAVLAGSVVVLSVDDPDRPAGTGLLSGSHEQGSGVVVAVAPPAASALARALGSDAPTSGVTLALDPPG